MHWWVVLKMNAKIYINIYVKIAPACIWTQQHTDTNTDLIYAATPTLY